MAKIGQEASVAICLPFSKVIFRCCVRTQVKVNAMCPGRILVIVSLCSFASSALAHDFVYPHSCIKPNYAIDYEDEEQLTQLNRDIGTYQECLREYVKFQLGQVQAHSDASSAAMNDLQAIADDILKHAPKELVEKWRAESSENETE